MSFKNSAKERMSYLFPMGNSDQQDTVWMELNEKGNNYSQLLGIFKNISRNSFKEFNSTKKSPYLSHKRKELGSSTPESWRKGKKNLWKNKTLDSETKILA